MRIAYGVHGYGRGHATRALGVLPLLSRRNEVLVLAGGDAREVLDRQVAVEEIPHLSYVYRGMRLSAARTLAANARAVLDLASNGPALRRLEARLAQFAPDVVVSDSDPFTLRAAGRLGIPRISFDHVGVIAHCRPAAPPGDALQLWRDARAYRLLVGPAERVVVSSFYDAPPRRRGVHRVPPVLRPSVLAARPSDGEHLLVYFNEGAALFGPHVEAAVRGAGLPARVYGSGRVGRDGPVTYRPFDPEAFVHDLASCRALLCTAGHQLASEALHLGKPMLVSPEDCAEQRLNAREVERLGFGRAVRHRDLSAAELRRFLAEQEAHRGRLAAFPRDGNERAVTVLEALARELSRGLTAPPALPVRRVASARR